MKTAIYIEDGVCQLVLTPENKFEQNALASFSDKPTETAIMQGSFYQCRGGWNRQGDGDQSLILRTVEKCDPPNPQE